jgi:glyoxylate reductase
MTSSINVFADSKLPKEVLDTLSQHCSLSLSPNNYELSTDELSKSLKSKDAFVCLISSQITAQLMDACPNLKLIANVAVGTDNIDIEAASERNILVLNTPNVLENTTADLAFALMLAVARRVVESYIYILDNKWDKWSFDFMLGSDVWGKKLGIIGLGQIGQCMAKRANGFDMEISYFQRNKAEAEIESQLKAKYVSLEQLLSDSDFVSIHCPLNKNTFHLLGTKELSLMKPSAILVNTARGAIIDQKALITILKTGKIKGAGLDVFENEPKIPDELKNLPNVVLTPHIGSATLETRTKMAQSAVNGLIQAFAGNMPVNIVNAKYWPNFKNRITGNVKCK